MKRIALILAVFVFLAFPVGASARTHHHHGARQHTHHRAHPAWVVLNGGCEELEGAVPWSQWRQDMAEAGFTQEETEEMEVCGDETSS